MSVIIVEFLVNAANCSLCDLLGSHLGFESFRCGLHGRLGSQKDISAVMVVAVETIGSTGGCTTVESFAGGEERG